MNDGSLLAEIWGREIGRTGGDSGGRRRKDDEPNRTEGGGVRTGTAR
jgi:hypothetical protein